MRIVFIILIWALLAEGKGKKGKKKKSKKVKVDKWAPDPVAENEQAETFDTHPLLLQARKLAKLAPHQNVVSTCRYILFKEPLPFHEAEKSCENLDWPIKHSGKMGLATVQNEDENLDIQTMIRIGFGFASDHRKHYKFGQWALIGLSKRTNNRRKLTNSEKGKFNPDEWSYQDGQKPKFSNFVHPMPDQQKKGRGRNEQYQNWVQVNKRGLWDDTFSSKPLPYICQYCGKYIVLSKQVTWFKAKEDCEEVGLEFATVNSELENQELWHAANESLGTDIYKPRFNDSNWIWIGENRNNETEKWEHHDGGQFDAGFEPLWDYKMQPDNFVLPKGEQRVVAFSRKNGKWDDSFTFKHRPFACMCPRDTCAVESP